MKSLNTIQDENLKVLIEQEVIKEKLLHSGVISEGLKYHIRNGLCVSENIFRPGSKGFFFLFSEVRRLSKKGKYSLSDDEKYYINETDIGTYGIYRGAKVPLDFPMCEDDILYEAEYKGREVELNKPKRGGSKKYYVYVRNPKTKNINKVEWGAKGMSVGISDPERRKSFVARHKCKTTKDKTTASYWACRTGRYPHLTGSDKKYRWR